MSKEIEKFFRVVKKEFLKHLEIPGTTGIGGIKDIETLNRIFDRWLYEEYDGELNFIAEETSVDSSDDTVIEGGDGING